jgi:hypothetical protein
MQKVYWTIPDCGSPELQIVFFEPESLFKHLQETRKGTQYLKCPAFQEYTKNTFVIKAPFDCEITVNRKKGTLDVIGVPQEYSQFIINRIDQVEPTNPYVMSTFPAYLFYSNDDISIESIHPFMELNDSISNTILIPGTYNISKWIRSIDFSFEVKDDTKKVKMTRGDVLFYVKFRTKDDSKVELERVQMTEELKSAEKTCFKLKVAIKNVPLKNLYTMAESFMKTLSFRKPKKCPFGFGKK